MRRIGFVSQILAALLISQAQGLNITALEGIRASL